MFADVYWHRGRVDRSRPGLAADVRVDVAIVGGGIGGLAVAWHLADRGVRTVIVEARGVATGASGRNGGFLIAGAAPMYNDARRTFGPDLARRIYRATLDAQADVIETATQIGAGEAIERVGLLRLAVDAGEAVHVVEHLAALVEDGFPGELVATADLPTPVRRTGRVGLWTAHDARVHPVRWLSALSAAVERRGTVIYEGTPVERVGVADGGAVVTTSAGRISAGHVVVANDAGVAALVPGYAGRIVPRRLHMVATAPGAAPHIPHPVYSRYGYEYHQQLPDGTIVLGGFSDLDAAESYTDREVASAVVHRRLAEYLRDDLGVRDPVVHRWVGIVGYTPDHRPFVGAADDSSRLHVMGGYCGTGNLCAWVGARIVADTLADGTTIDADLFDARR